MGRMGTLGAWEHDSVVPDIHIAERLGSGYVRISTVATPERVIAAIKIGPWLDLSVLVSSAHPFLIMQDKNLVQNVHTTGIVYKFV
jgi:adenosylmethionine-8-amino-7-oxononanoate aminotransferase